MYPTTFENETAKKSQVKNLQTHSMAEARTTDAQCSLFSSKFQTIGLRQTIWADKFCGIRGIFGQFIRTYSIVQPLFPQKTKPLYPPPKYSFGIGI